MASSNAGKHGRRSAGFFCSLCDRLGASFNAGAVSRFLGGYGKGEKALADSSVSKFLFSLKGDRRRLRLKAAALFEQSVTVNKRAELLRALTEIPSKSYAVFFLVFFAVSSALRLLRGFFEGNLLPSAFLESSSFALVLATASFPLFFSDRSVSELLNNSAFFSRLLSGWMDIPSERLGRRREAPSAVPLAVLAGILTGAAAWFVSPDAVLKLILFLLFLGLLTDYPRSGVLLLIFLTPFLSVFDRPSLLLGIMLAAVAAGWISKLLRGRRSLYIGLSDIPVLLLAADLFVSGFFGGAAFSIRSALMRTALLAGYFLCANLVRSYDSLARSAGALAFSGAAVSIIGIWEYLSGRAPLDWLDISGFPGIDGRVISLFDNPNMLAVFLAAAFPAALWFTSSDRVRERIAGLFSSALIAVCSVLTWSRSGWIGLVFGAVVFFLVSEGPRGLLSIPFAAGGAALASAIFPGSVGARLGRFFSLSDSANGYRVRVWNGAVRALRDFFFTGAGSGDIAFRNVFLFYALPGTSQAPHSHSLWLQLAVQLGLPGLCLFAASLILLAVKTVSSCRDGKRSGDRRSVSLCAAFFAGVSSVCAAGFFDFTLYNYRIFFIFCCVAGLASASADVCRRAAENRDLLQGFDSP